MNSTKCVIFSNEVVKPLGTFYIHPTTEYCLVKLRRSTMLYGGLPQYGLSVLSYAHAGTVPICPDNCLHQRHLECHPDPSIPRAHSLAVTGIPPTCSLYSSGISTTAGHFRVGVCVVDPPVLAMLSNNLPLPGELGCELSGYLASWLHSTKRAPIGLLKGCWGRFCSGSTGEFIRSRRWRLEILGGWR